MRHARKRWTWWRRNLIASIRATRELGPDRDVVTDLTRYERRHASQNGEDGILDAIFRIIGTRHRYFVEIGAGNGYRCNGAYWRDTRGWSGLQVDGAVTSRSHPTVQQAFVTAECIESRFADHGVPAQFDFLSIDVDGNDYWIWKAISAYRPRVVVIEYNPAPGPVMRCVMPYRPDHVWDRTDHYSASLQALASLGRRKGYTLVSCDSSGTNAFFVETRLVPGRFAPRDTTALYRPATYRFGLGHPPSDRPMVEV